jgi:hypothetical protein
MASINYCKILSCKYMIITGNSVGIGIDVGVCFDEANK